MAETIHYIDVAIRIRFDPEREPRMLEVARKLTQEIVTIRANEDDPDDESMRSMTDEEVAEDVSCAQDTSNENGPRPRIPGVRIGDRWRYSEAAIERWLKELGIDRGTTK
jgi:hypothetical protein